MYSRDTFSQIEISNLKNNYKLLKEKSNHPFFCCMVKANAYGHGDLECVKALEEEGCLDFGVALLEEAINLRKHFDQINIFLFGNFKEKHVQKIVANKVTPVIFKWPQLEALSKMLQKPLSIHLKFNVGMNRLGFSPDEIEELKSFIESNPLLKLEGVCGHLPSAENLTNENSSSVLHEKNFDKIFQAFDNGNVIGHLYNSAGLLSGRNKKYGCRVGIALYGSDPFFDTENVNKSIKPVMNLYAEVIDVKNVKKGDTVSYNETWVASENSKVAILAIGYADGMKISLSNVGYVFIENTLCKILGRVCMDYTMVDVSHLEQEPRALEGKTALIFGDCKNIKMHPNNVAKIAQTIAYELFTGISFRVQKTYSND